MTSTKSPLAAVPAAAAPAAGRAQHTAMANAIRTLAMDAVEQAKSGHPGLPMGAADVATVLFADNGISIDGPLSLADAVDQVKRFEAAGWAATRIDGHDPEAIERAIAFAQASDRPTLIACKTTIGFGAPKKAGTSKA